MYRVATRKMGELSGWADLYFDLAHCLYCPRPAMLAPHRSPAPSSSSLPRHRTGDAPSAVRRSAAS